MKIPKSIYMAIILLLSAGCHEQKQNGVTITGKIVGDIPEKVEYTVPVNGTCFWGFKESVKPDSLGKFQIKIALRELTFIKLRIPQKSDITLIAEPNKNYIINFDLTKKDASQNFKIHGDDKEAQEAYNTLSNPAHIQVAARPFLKDSTALQIQSKITDLKEQDLSKFKDLLEQGDIDQSLYDFVALDRDYYYTAVQGTVGFIKFLTNERQKGVFTEDIKTMWKNTFDNDLLMRPDFQKTNWGYALVENYLFYKGYDEVAFDNEKFKNSLVNTFYPKKVLANSEKYLSPHILEFFKAAYL